MIPTSWSPPTRAPPPSPTLANAISAEYGFWLGDAFASGGSAGYDHKKMAITARGAWECVKRHFRELGRDIQREPFTVAGIGDMSGDVFGNGMLLSPQIRLVAAFNHQHIFIDPESRCRRAATARARSGCSGCRARAGTTTTARLLSRGGGIFERSAKSVTLSPRRRRCWTCRSGAPTPSGDHPRHPVHAGRPAVEWRHRHLRQGQPASATARSAIAPTTRCAWTAAQVRARVVGEGGNLGFSQRGRIEYAAAGGRINTDFIDNSAGVNTSDVEVNLKILLDAPGDGAPIARARRNRLLRGRHR